MAPAQPDSMSRRASPLADSVGPSRTRMWEAPDHAGRLAQSASVVSVRLDSARWFGTAATETIVSVFAKIVQTPNSLIEPSDRKRSLSRAACTACSCVYCPSMTVGIPALAVTS